MKTGRFGAPFVFKQDWGRFMGFDAAFLTIFNQMLISVAEEMGSALCYSAYSANIKERRDFSCAIFDAEGSLMAQAAHIPVHLGALPLGIKKVIETLEESSQDVREGDLIIWNDPYKGGTHLPDITMLTGVYYSGKLVSYLISRAHHADIGGMSPASMPLSREIFQEGLIIPPIFLVKGGITDQDVLSLILANVRTPKERKGDIQAQIGCHYIGEKRLKEHIGRYGYNLFERYKELLFEYSALLTKESLSRIPYGKYTFTDFLDGDGFSEKRIPITASIERKREFAEMLLVDFEGTSGPAEGPVNCPESVTCSAVYYVVRCLIGEDVPFNQGCISEVKISIPKDSLLSADFPRAVAGGNVETSQRVVDVLLGALAHAIDGEIPAASYGTMSNLSFGGRNKDGSLFAYYETVGGGCGARPERNGFDATHDHMTNTQNTPAEALEFAFPVRIESYSVIDDTGGTGRFRGGNAAGRKILFLEEVQATIISDRRKVAPYGLQGGAPGSMGSARLIKANGDEIQITGKESFSVKKGDMLEIRTPGGGGFGRKFADESES